MEIKDINWKDLGLKCGIEIHGQLEGTKLFCNCLTRIRDDEPDVIFKRKLRAVAGELGQLDKAAQQEMQKDRTYNYEAYTDGTCLVEMDEEPPHPISQNNINTALMVAKLLKANIVDEIHTMRKTIVDGSNTAGFQRTTLIAINGAIITATGTIGIPAIVLEEDAAKNIKEDANTVTYRLDRLGIPLLEISTTPDITTPEHCKEVAEAIGLLLRSTGKSKRGLGTIRQDVNVSIKGGTRVEIKGVQDLRLLPKVVATEALRQKKLLEIKEELTKRKTKEIPFNIVDVTQIMKHSGSKIIAQTITKGGVVFSILLSGFAGLIGTEIQPNKRLGTEFSERAKVIARVGGIFHSDELPAYGIEQREINEIREILLCKPNDAFVLVADEKTKTKKALNAVVQRALEAITGVPSEVRKVNEDATTNYLRPMPSAARMYPETDVQPLNITKEQIAAIKLPELIENKIRRYETFGLSKDTAQTLAKSDKTTFFEQSIQQYKKIKPAYIAEILVGVEKAVKTQHNVEINPTEEDFETLFDALNKGEIAKENTLEILRQNKPVTDIIHQYKLMSDAELKETVKNIVDTNKGLAFNALIGKAMQQLRGKAEGKKIVEMLQKMAG